MRYPYTDKVSHQIKVSSENVDKYGISFNNGPETFVNQTDHYINYDLGGSEATGTIKVKGYDGEGNYLNVFDTLSLGPSEYLVESGLAQFHSGVNRTHSGSGWAPENIQCRGWGDIGWSLSVREGVKYLTVGLLTTKEGTPANFDTLKLATKESLALWYLDHGAGSVNSGFQETYLLPLTTENVWVHATSDRIIHPYYTGYGNFNSWAGVQTGVCGLGRGGWMFRARLLSGNRIQVQINNLTNSGNYILAGSLVGCNDATDMNRLAAHVGDLTPHVTHGIQCNFASQLGLAWKRYLYVTDTEWYCRIFDNQCTYTFSF